jgi:hypothetical protein
VNAHHQNGVAERHIRKLQELTCTSLIHANRHWPKCITAHLWPYALRMASNAFNHVPNLKGQGKQTPIQLFSKTQVQTDLKHFHPFGCPVYVLRNELQKQAPFHKWRERSKVGIYLGPLPQHVRNVSLVLSRDTGLVSPQFHVHHDPLFESVQQDILDSRWQEKAGLLDIKVEGSTKQKKSAKAKKKAPDRAHKNHTTVPEGAGVTGNIPQSEGAPHSEGATRSPDRTMEDQYNSVQIPQTTLQYKSSSDSSANVHKRLKTSHDARQASSSLKNPNRVRSYGCNS